MKGILLTLFMQLARARWSVRSFSSRPVDDEKLHKILEAGLIAPTAVNYQPQKIYVLQSDVSLRKIRSITRGTYNAPTVLLVCYDRRLSWKSPFVEGYDCGEMDATIVCTHMMLEAWDIGIGSCWVLLFDPAKVIKAFNLPPHIVPVCLLPIGYPAPGARPYAPWHDTFNSTWQARWSLVRDELIADFDAVTSDNLTYIFHARSSVKSDIAKRRSLIVISLCHIMSR